MRRDPIILYSFGDITAFLRSYVTLIRTVTQTIYRYPMDKDRPSEEEELRRKATERFFEEAEFKPRQVYKLVIRLSDYITINRKGEASIKKEDMTTKDKVGLVVCARFLGSLLDEEITPVVSTEELVRYTLIQKNAVSARLTELVREGVVTRSARGSFTAKSLSAAKRFIEGMISKLEA